MAADTGPLAVIDADPAGDHHYTSRGAPRPTPYFQDRDFLLRWAGAFEPEEPARGGGHLHHGHFESP